MKNIFLICLLGINISASEAATELPVRWTDYMNLEDVAEKPPKVPNDFSRVFNSAWLGPNVVQVEVKNRSNGSTSLVTIGNCSQALANKDNIITKDQALWDYITSKILTCRLFQQMEKMSPSKISHVDHMSPKDFVKALNRTKLDSKYSQVRNLFIGLKDKESIIRCDGQFHCTYKTLLNIYEFYILAFGDYDHDGIEDVLFQVRNNYRDGTGFFRVALIGTKKTEEAPFRIIKVID